MTNPAVARLLAARERSLEAGDGGLVAEIDHQLARWGVTADEQPAEVLEDRPQHSPERSVPKRTTRR